MDTRSGESHSPALENSSDPPGGGRDRSSGPRSRVAIAPIGDPGGHFGMAARTIDRAAFQPRVGTIVASVAAIALSIWLAMLLGIQGFALVIVAFVVSLLAGAVLVINATLRWELAESAYEKERSAAEKWNRRFVKLHSESTRTNSVLSHTADGVLMLSPATEIVLINDAARRLLALASDDIYLGRKFAELVRVPEIVQAVQKTVAEQIDQSVAVEIVDGSSVRPIGVRVNRVQDTEPPHLLLVIRDETEAQRVEAVRREFIANVSHELKTPLAAIKGYAETVELAIEDDAESAKHFIAQIGNQCLRLEDLIADMMRLARAQSGKGTLQLKTLDLQAVIRQAMTSFAPVAKAKQIELTVVTTNDDVLVLADEEAALTITQNLISNAIRHTEKGGHVTVSCRRERDGWLMAIQDDGIGIAPEFQERIFERFYRVDRSRKTADGGTGIGLSIVKNLARALDGTVGVVSSPGEGATFEIWLPAPE